MQNNIDSATFYYNKAIIDIEKGEDLTVTQKKYENKIHAFYSNYKQQFTAITDEYMKGKIDSIDYERVIQGLKIDSVSNKMSELKKLGLAIQLE